MQFPVHYDLLTFAIHSNIATLTFTLIKILPSAHALAPPTAVDPLAAAVDAELAELADVAGVTVTGVVVGKVDALAPEEAAVGGVAVVDQLAGGAREARKATTLEGILQVHALATPTVLLEAEVYCLTELAGETVKTVAAEGGQIVLAGPFVTVDIETVVG